MHAMASLDSRSMRGLAWFAGCAIVLSTFGSCKIVDEPIGPQEPESPKVYLAGLSGLGAKVAPQAATWRMRGDTAEVSLVRDRNGGIVAVKAVLDSAPSDTVRVGLWRAGVRFGQAIYRYDGSPSLERLGYLADGLAEGILAKMDDSTTSGSFESVLAKVLVEGDPLLDDNPYRVPEGADSGALQKFVAIELLETGKPFDEAVAAGAPLLDTNGLKDLIRQLVDSGVVEDTSKIFPPTPPLPPPPPPQDRTPPSVRIVSPVNDSVLPSGLDAVDVLVRVDDSSGVDSVWIAGFPASRRDRDWILEALGFPATESVLRILVRAKDPAGNEASESVQVRRQGDTAGPEVSVVTPSDGAKLAHDSDSVSVKVVAQDMSGVDSVWIGGVHAVLANGYWIAKVSVPVGKSGIEVRAVDGAGNVSSADVSVDRAAPPPRDSLGPSIRVLAPILRDLPYDSTAVTISVLVVDAGGLASFRIGDSLVPGSDSVFARRVDLAAGTNLFVLDAQDRSGNRSVDSLVLVRSPVPPPDTAPPVLKRGKGAVSRSVPFDSSFALVAWSVWDDRKLSEVRIGDSLVVGDEGVFFRALPLRVGGNVVVAKATDSTGNSASDTVRIVREQDTSRPVVVDRPDAEVVLPQGVSGTDLSWKIHDNLPMKVSIGDVPVSGDDSVYSRWILVVGPSVSVTLVATDEAGNTTREVVVVRRSGDTLGPQLRRNAGTNDTTVSGDTQEWNFGWVVRDNSSLKIVEICGIPIDMEASDSSFSGKAQLEEGPNVFWIEAEDAYGNSSSDTIRVTKLPSGVGSPRSSSPIPAARKAPSIVVFVTGKEQE